MQTHYQTIEKPATAEFKDRGSRFIAYVFPISASTEFKARLNDMKKEHPKATHHCFAYRIGLEGNDFRSSDAGEPAGSAGKPILSQIDSRDLTNTLVFVVRYFGGTLLGVPGLINAYKSAAALALQLTPVIKKAVEKNYVLEFDYTRMNEVMTIVKQHNCSVISQEMQLFCELTVGIPQGRLEEVLYRLKEARVESRARK